MASPPLVTVLVIRLPSALKYGGSRTLMRSRCRTGPQRSPRDPLKPRPAGLPGGSSPRTAPPAAHAAANTVQPMVSTATALALFPAKRGIIPRRLPLIVALRK